MTTLFKFLSGNTSDFAIEIEIQEDDYPDDDLRSSWGALRIWSHGINLCAHREDGNDVDAVHWYLLPFLEWSARNWDAIFHEERLPVLADGEAGAGAALSQTACPPPVVEGDLKACLRWEGAWQSWWSRHAIQSCREGGIFPDLVFRRWRDVLELSWTSESVAGQPDHFRFNFPFGVTHHDVKKAAEVWFELLRLSASYLRKELPKSTRIRKLKADIDHLASTDRHNNRLQLLAGAADRREVVWWQGAVSDVRKRSRAAYRAIMDLGPGTGQFVIEGHCHAALMFGSVDPQLGNADRAALMGCLIDAFDPKGDGPTLKKLVRPSRPTRMAGRPWQDGYELAREVIQKLNIESPDGFVDIEGVCRKLGIDIRNITLTDSGIRGVSVAGPSHRSTVWINQGDPHNAHEPSRRFTLAHELCHILHDRISGSKLAIASGPWAPDAIEKRANAFAAMLLMPEPMVRAAFQNGRSARIGSGDLTERVKKFAETARVSVKAAQRHLQNLGFIPKRDGFDF